MTAKEKSEKMVNMQHDIHNSIDRIQNQLNELEEYNRNSSKWAVENNVKIPKHSVPYVVAEHLKTHIKNVRDIANAMYEISKIEKL